MRPRAFQYQHPATSASRAHHPSGTGTPLAEHRTLAEVEDLALLRYAVVGPPAAHRRRIGRLDVGRLFRVARSRCGQFQGQWLQLDPATNSSSCANVGNCQLGQNLVIGERVWDVEGKIRVRVGPLDYEQFVEFLPYRGAVNASRERSSCFAPGAAVHWSHLEFDVQVLLRARRGARHHLGRSSRTRLAARLEHVAPQRQTA